MSEANRIYEITQQMRNEQVVKQDMNEATELVKSLFHRKYIAPMQQELEKHSEKVKSNPSREVNLVRAFKPFLPTEQHGSIDQMVEMLHTMEMFKTMKVQQAALQSEVKPEAAETDFVKENTTNPLYDVEEDTSVHRDGVYDIDAACVAASTQKPNMAMLLLMATLMGKRA